MCAWNSHSFYLIDWTHTLYGMKAITTITKNSHSYTSCLIFAFSISMSRVNANWRIEFDENFFICAPSLVEKNARHNKSDCLLQMIIFWLNDYWFDIIQCWCGNIWWELWVSEKTALKSITCDDCEVVDFNSENFLVIYYYYYYCCI